MHDLVIIGAGPAGLAAALYAGRYRLDTVILEKAAPGGQIVLSQTIENYPGFPGGLQTQELIERCKQQVEEVGLSITMEEVVEIAAASEDPATYTVKTGEGSYETRSVIIASGAQPKRLGVAGEEGLTGRGVSYCATCDGPFFRDKEVAVIGGGDRAVEEALLLTTYARTVSLVHRRDQLRASKILEEKARANSRIKFFLECIVDEIKGKDRVEGVSLQSVRTGAREMVAVQGVFIFVGIVPNTGFLKGAVELDKAGFIVTAEDTATSRKGIFACGDCRKKSLYQVVTACADGATAASTAQRYLL